MSFHGKGVVVDAKRVAAMSQHMTIEQISERFGIQLGDIEDMLAEAGLRGNGKWVLECQKTGRNWRCFSERGCYLKAQMLGLTDYNFGRDTGGTSKFPAPLIEKGSIDAQIAEMRGRGMSFAKIGMRIGISAPAVLMRVRKMEAK